MRLDRILQLFLPKDEHFYGLFEEAARNIVEASETLIKLPVAKTVEERTRIVDEIGFLEHRGDDVTHRIFSHLSGTFVTPFDPEDIHLLASELDDIVDNIDGTARRFLMYKIEESPPDIICLVESLHGSVCELERGVKMLRKLERAAEIRKIIDRVNLYEDEADVIFARGVASLFDTLKDPIQIIKLKEIYVAIETATDKCEDAVDVIETILIKHA